MLLPLGAFVLAIFLWPALLTFDAGDWPSPNQYPHHDPAVNACGLVGAWCAYHLRHLIGDGTYPLLLFASLASVLRLVRGELGSLWERLFGLALVVLSTSASVDIISASKVAALPVGDGGMIGFALGSLLTQNLSSVGTFIVLASSLIVGLVFATEGWVLTLPAMLKHVGEVTTKAVATARPMARLAAAARPTGRSGDGVTSDESEALLQIPEPSPKINGNRRGRTKKADEAQPQLFDADAHEMPSAAEDLESAEVPDKEGSPSEAELAKARAARLAKLKKAAKAAGLPIVNVASPPEPAAGAYPKQIENWRLPSLDLLHEPEYGFTAQQEIIIREQAKVLERTLEEFRLDARVVEIDTGPVITMYELRLGAGIKVSQIASLSNDIARALKAHAIRVVAPISGKNTVGIEVPNADKVPVRLKELMTLAGKKASEMGLPLFLGKDASGSALVADLTKMPHMLIAGTTGSGKSVGLNAMIVSMLMTKRPDHVKLILVDPKMVEMSQFKDVPHLMCPIVTDMAKAEKILEWAVTKMEERYELLAEARVKNISSYNRLGADEIYNRLEPKNDAEKARIATQLPYIVIVIDELADLMMTSGKEVEHHLSRLAQKSRAVGLHIMVATQRPEAKVVTGLIKSNLPCRMCFRVASRMDSRIVLDQNGGEVLLGQGDMLFLPPGSHKLIRAQGTFLGDSEVQAVLDDLAARAKPEFHPELMKIKNPTTEENLGVRDPLFDKAVEVILQSQRGSVSLLQRSLTIGYSRASRLVDQMAEAGIVGDYKGSQAREVNMTLDEWRAMRADVDKDLEQGYEADQDDFAEGDGADDSPWEDDAGAVPALSDDHDIRD